MLSLLWGLLICVALPVGATYALTRPAGLKHFFWRILSCLLPVVFCSYVVVNAITAYYEGKGGFKLGVDLAGGTILVYEIDEKQFPDGKVPSDFKPEEMARRIKSRIDPSDLYSITVRSGGDKKRFEVILPTGGAHQIAAEQKRWDELLRLVEDRYPIKKYIAPVDGKIELLASVQAQYADDKDFKIAEVETIIKENYKPQPVGKAEADDKKDGPKEAGGDKKDPAKEAGGDKKDPAKEAADKNKAAWETLLTKVSEKWPPKHYQVGRGKYAELGNLIVQQYPETSVDDIRTLLSLCESEHGIRLLKEHPKESLADLRKLAQEQQVPLDTTHRKGKRGQNLNTEEVEERKNLIAKVGSLEFRIIANPEVDQEAIDAARKYIESAKTNPEVKAELDRLAFQGKPPPPPRPDKGDAFDTKQGRYTYSWFELGSFFRHDHGLANPRDPSTGNLIPPPPLPPEGKPDDPEYKKAKEEWEKKYQKTWVAAFESQGEHRMPYAHFTQAAQARAEGKTLMLPGTGLIYSREVKNPRLPEKDKDKQFEYFILTRDPETPDMRITGDMVAGARPSLTGEVEFSMKPAGASLFYEFTKKNIKQLMCIILDGYVESAATIQSAISDRGQITGNFTPEKVNETVQVLRSGALTASLKPDPVSESTMGATLGADTIYWGTLSVVLAFGCVLLFMLVYYQFSGLVACIALLANLILTVAFMVLIDATFTLPGLAGLVLMLGMAVDANVLIYERLREEKDRGASLAMSIRNGYDHALPTIIDTHVSSIFTAIVLYVVGNDQLKGFGISLTVGLIISLFTSLYMTRLIFDFCMEHNWLHDLSMFRLLSKPNINFMAIRYYWFTATVILTIVGGTLFIMRDKAGLNIDFTGGTAYSGELKRPIDLLELRRYLAKSELPEPSVEQIFISAPGYTDGDKSKLFTVRTPLDTPDSVQRVQDAINRCLGKGDEGNGPDLLKIINLSSYQILPDGKGATLSFIDPVTTDPAFTSRAQVSMLLGRELKAQGLETAAQGMALEGLGKDYEGRFQWMDVRFLEPVDKSKLTAALEATKKELAKPQPERLEKFDAQLAGETQLRALYAILASWGAILLYLWFRFGNWTFGAATVLCLIHDLFFTLGCIAACHYICEGMPGLAYALRLTDFKIDLPAVAALLTLVGYSVSDTIVVFDRIREVRGKNPELTAKMINDSVNQTLSRTILASMSVWLVVIVLYLFGGEGVHLFAFVMVVGVIVGTYSSIYIASPLLLIFGEGAQAAASAQRARETAEARS